MYKYLKFSKLELYPLPILHSYEDITVPADFIPVQDALWTLQTLCAAARGRGLESRASVGRVQFRRVKTRHFRVAEGVRVHVGAQGEQGPAGGVAGKAGKREIICVI